MICFDTAPVIWGVQGVAKPAQSEMVARTMKYIDHLDKAHERIMIPAPAISEYLVGLPPDKQVAAAAALSSKFFIPALDLPAAIIAASLQANTNLLKAIRKDHQVDRQSVRVDAMILAIAIAQGVKVVVTNDLAHMGKLAQGRVQVIEVPEIPLQTELFP